MRKTKIVCTMGPSCSDHETLKQMCEAGMNVARLNFSHGTHESHAAQIELIKKVRDELHLPIAIMLDTKGPEYRIKTFKDGNIELKDGDTFTFTSDEIEGDKERVSVNYKDLPSELAEGDTIYLNDGLMEFKVRSINGNDIICDVLTGGTLSDRKSMSFPGKVLKQVYLSEADKEDIAFGITQGIDFIACSFVSCKQDMDDVRAFVDSKGGNDIELIAKIENQSGVDNIEEICRSCSGVMVARGDMGVEIAYERLPEIQKQLIGLCLKLGKRSITATEMLESMINSPRPTRAEISDVANAVYDGTSAVMLSGETAAGKYPVEAVKAMAKIASQAETDIDYIERFFKKEKVIKNVSDAISHSTCDMAIAVGAKAIAACTISGITARMVSRYRTPINIIGLTPKKTTWRRLSLSWGVTPSLCNVYDTTDEMFEESRTKAKELLGLSEGDMIVVTSGITSDDDSSTNVISVEKL